MTRREILFLLCVVAAVAVGIALVPTRPPAPAAGLSLEQWDAATDDRSKCVTLSWLGPPIMPGAKKGTWIERRLEKAFNVDLRGIFLDGAAFGQNRPLMFMAGDVPDVVWDGDPLPFRRNVDQGFVMELPYEVILKHAPQYVKMINTYCPKAWLYTYYRGRNYGVPTLAASDIYPPAMAWRKDWLDNVGIAKVPDTLDEMHEAFYRFRHNDPDRNGKKDTYAFCPGAHWSIAFIDVFAAFNVLPQDFVERDGRVVWGGVTPEARQALAVLRQWYAEELIDPDYVAANSFTDLSMDRFKNGRTGYITYVDDRQCDSAYPHSLFADLLELNAIRRKNGQENTVAQLVPAAPPRGIDGKRRYRFWGGPAHSIWFGQHMAKTPEKVLRTLHMFEELCKPANGRLFIESRIGQEGTHWKWDARQGVVPLYPYSETGQDARNLLAFWGLENAYGFYSFSSAPLEVTDKYLPASIKEFRAKYRRTEYGLMNAIGKTDVVDSAGRNLDDLRQLQTEVYTDIIRGKRPLEYFDTFVEQWKQRGGDLLTREANELYAIMGDIYRQVGVAAATQPATQEARP
ncbi:MAG: extracellular solute-binding protein [Planctomycetaceae bacterium]|nr:extracellular solute-binding protein [Planctomycetaceae bacterium]